MSIRLIALLTIGWFIGWRLVVFWRTHLRSSLEPPIDDRPDGDDDAEAEEVAEPEPVKAMAKAAGRQS